MFLNSCLIHGYMPKAMLFAVFTPRVKNKYGDLGSSVNYREIVISSMLLKLFEYCILPNLIENDILSPLQFAYRPKSSTTLAAVILKEVLTKYTSESSNVYTCFMDMSKAFERVNHDLLIKKLTELKIYPLIVRAIEFILKNSTACVKFKDSLSTNWCITRGVRQGGVTSVHLFCIYIDQILTQIA